MPLSFRDQRENQELLVAWDLWVLRYGALCDCNSDCNVLFTLIFIGFDKTTLFGCLYCTLKGPTGMSGERGRIGPTGPVVSDYFLHRDEAAGSEFFP